MKLLFVGDVMLGRLVNRRLEHAPAEYPWGDVLGVFKGADARICNLECVISDRSTPWSCSPKMFHFRSDARNIACLKAAGINAVTLANNHVLDFGYDAAIEMKERLEGTGIACAGAGRTLQEAMRPAVLERAGLMLSIISFTDNEPAWEALGERTGVFYVPVNESDQRARALFDMVKKAREQSDVVVVSAHWGPNWGYRPAPAHRPFARRLIESGADIIFGHSCHVFQGVEIYRHRPIIYSAGDFIDDYAIEETERNDETFVFTVDAEKGGITGMRLYPALIKDMHAALAAPPRAGLIAARMKTLSAELGTEADWDAGRGVLEIRINRGECGGS